MWHQANYVLMPKVVFRSNCRKGGTGLWTARLEEDVKDSIRKDGLFVKLAHFVGVLGSFGCAGLMIWGLMGKELLCKMLWMMFSSCWYSSCCRL